MLTKQKRKISSILDQMLVDSTPNILLFKAKLFFISPIEFFNFSYIKYIEWIQTRKMYVPKTLRWISSDWLKEHPSW